MAWGRTPALTITVMIAALALGPLRMAADAGAAQPATVSRDACPAPVPGRITCDARMLVLRRSHKPVRPRIGHPRDRHDVASTGQPAPQPLTPAYLQQAYDLTQLSAAHGSGDTVAIVGVYDDPTAASDLDTFRSTYGLPACGSANGCFEQLNQQGQPSPLPAGSADWSVEESMDIEAVSALCPNCRIDLVEASDADAADLQAAVGAAIAAGADQVSISGDGVYTQDPFTDFSAPGVSIVAATGDGGVLPPGQAAYPAALPFVTAVGGTSLQPASPSSPTPRGVTETAWSGSSAGCDTTQQPLPYQPADGCVGRAYADVSADADPATGMTVYDSAAGGWFEGGGTSLAAPLVAAFEAITGVDGSTPQWAYADAAELNDPVSGSTGGCVGQLTILCNAGAGYDGPTGAGSISGQVVPGAPGIGLPSFGPTGDRTYVRTVSSTSASLQGGLYPNGEPTRYYWQYGPTTAYGSRTTSGSGAGTAPLMASVHLSGLRPGTAYHYRLVATNAAGTSYGYDGVLTTAGRVRVATAGRHAANGHRHRRR
jgi:hypothetical protein